jgi:tetratricopeptide (TPR) repeat protein
MDYQDLTLKHLRKTLAIQAGAALAGETRQQREERLSNFGRAVAALEKNVEKQMEDFELKYGHLRVLDRVKAAGRMGLAGKALDILLDSHVATFGSEGLEIELKLLLNTGQAGKARDWLMPEHEQQLGTSQYYLIQGQIEAALGNFEQAEKAFLEGARYRPLLKNPIPIEALPPLLVGHTLMFEAGLPLFKMFTVPTILEFPNLSFMPRRMEYSLGMVNRHAVTQTVLGVLALESGQADKASRYFRSALDFWDSTAGNFFHDPESTSGRQIAEYFLERVPHRN